MKVIFESDDMGFSYGSVEAIRDASLEGIATSASLVVNGDAFPFACRILRTRLKKIGLGLHVNLTDGIGKKSVLTDERGIYKYNFLSLFWLSLVRRQDTISAVEREIKEQLKKAESRGRKIDHINSERYVLMIPAFFEVACKIARVNKIKYIRLSNEPFFQVTPFLNNLKPLINLNIIKFLLLNFLAKINRRILRRYSLKCADAMYGILYTNNMDEEVIQSAIIDGLKRKSKVIEIFTHPGYPRSRRDKSYTSQRLKKYLRLKNRRKEAEVLKSSRLKSFLKENKIDLVSYRNL